jgi:hypothetical protein
MKVAMFLYAHAAPSRGGNVDVESQNMRRGLNGCIISAAILIAKPVPARAGGYVAAWVGVNGRLQAGVVLR